MSYPAITGEGNQIFCTFVCMERQELLNKIKNGIASKDPDAQVYLYGSRARGDYAKDSDWDILVLSPNETITYNYELGLRGPIFDIELESGEVISLLVYSKKEWSN